MTKRVCLLLLLVFELTWLVYLGLLLPVAVSMFTHAPEPEIRRLLFRLVAIMPFVLIVSALSWAAAIFDITTRPNVSRRLLWCTGVIVLGMLVMPIYYALHVHRRAPAA